MVRFPKNDYYVCPVYKDDPEPWNPYASGPSPHTHMEYFGGIFREMEKRLDERGLTIYMTWKTDELPSYGQDVVAVVVGDEWGQYPLYTNRVRAVFKMMGNDFPLEASPFRSPPYLTAVTAVKYLRTQLHRFPNVVQAWQDQKQGPDWNGGEPVPTFDVPIGYVNQEDLPLKPFSERRYDLYFSGSVSNASFPWYSPQYWLRTPKDVARSGLVRAMRRIQETRPDLEVCIDLKDAYVPNDAEENNASVEGSYSEMMMNTRICPVPRGTRLETGRLYEALRCGCVIVSEPLPDRWFCADLPSLTVHDWSELPELVDALIEHPARLQELHEASLEWWERKCSEEAVGRYMADQLGDLIREPASISPGREQDAALA